MSIDFSQAIAQIQQMINSVIERIPNMLVAAVLFVVFISLARVVRMTVTRAVRGYQRQSNLALVLGRLSQWGVVLLGFLVAAVIVFPNFSPADLISFLGVSSVAIGFAFRDILQNFLAGILLLLTEPFRVGDQIIFGSYEGTVEDIETRATMIRTYDGRRVVIPNGELFTNSVMVNTAFENRRLEYDIGIGYSDDIDTAKQVILQTLADVPEVVLAQPAPEVVVQELGDFNVKLRIRWWINPPKRRAAVDTRDIVLQRVKNALTENGIDLPFPTTHVLLHDQTEYNNGYRRQEHER